MSTQRISVADFAAKIKAKYPDYSDIDDSELTRRIIAKHPEYADVVEMKPEVSARVISDPEEIKKAQGETSEDDKSAASRFGTGVYQTTIGPVKDIYDHHEQNVKELTEKYGAIGNSMATLKTIFDLGKGLIKASNDEGVKTLQAIGRMDFGDAIKHLPGIVPGIGPAAVQAGDTMQKGDIAGGLGQATGLIGTSLIPEAVKSVPIKAPLNAMADVLEKSAANSYRKILEPTAQKMVPLAEETAKNLAPTKIMAISRESLISKVKALREEAGPAAGAAYKDKPPVIPDKIFSDLEGLRRKHAIIKGTSVVSNPALNDVIDDIKTNLQMMQLENDGQVSLIPKNQPLQLNAAPREMPPTNPGNVPQAIVTKEENFGPLRSEPFETWRKQNIDKKLDDAKNAQLIQVINEKAKKSGLLKQVQRDASKQGKPVPKKLSDIYDIYFSNKGKIPQATLDDYADKLNRGLVDANGNYRSQVAPGTLKSIQQSAARSIKRVLNSASPDAQQLNATYKLYADTYKLLEAGRRKRIIAESGITTGSATGFGAMTKRMLPAPVRNIPEQIAGIFDSVPWRTASGAMKQSISEAIADGNWDKAETLMKMISKKSATGARSLILAGQSQHISDEQPQ